MSGDQEQAVLQNQRLALVLGFNELAKTAPTLGDKVSYRLMRDTALKEYREHGGQLTVTEDTELVTIKLGDRINVRFTEKDVELMRAAVAAYDAKAAKTPLDRMQGTDLAAAQWLIDWCAEYGTGQDQGYRLRRYLATAVPEICALRARVAELESQLSLESMRAHELEKDAEMPCAVCAARERFGGE